MLKHIILEYHFVSLNISSEQLTEFLVFDELVSDNGCQESSVSKATGYGLDSRVSIPSWGKKYFSTVQHPDQLWGSTRLLCNGYWALFLQSKATTA
jgi:hypothetical protein